MPGEKKDRQKMLTEMVNVIEEGKEVPEMLYRLSSVVATGKMQWQKGTLKPSGPNFMELLSGRFCAYCAISIT